MVANYTEEEVKKAHEILFNEGVKMRYQVAGKDYVDAALTKRSDPFAGAMQDVCRSPINENVVPLLTTPPVRHRILLGLDLDSPRARAQNPLLPQHRHALLPESRHGACDAR